MSIQVENIRKAFGDFVALNDVSLNFPSGELVALLGPSGCGKTTLLRIIAGLEQADRGRVLLDGEDASATHVRERQVGFVFQHYALFRHMSVFDNVAFGLRMKPRRERPSEAEIARRVHELLDLVQLNWLADRFPAQLSGGQRQRIALARALAVQPRVLLLDEPFGALDAKVRKELRRWLRKLHDELHITSLFVTHDQEEALEVADRVVLMNHGQVEQIGSPAEVYSQPASAFVYGFLGSANRIRGVSGPGAIAVGGQLLNTEHQQPHGQAVEAFIRPHELAIVPDHGPGLPARVQRVLTLGGLARVELEGRDELAGQTFDAELPADAPLLQTLAAGQPVRLQARAARVFAAAQGAEA
ncbi:sulfate/molybdate ABC transporter ATP-binding protein [Chromobacterium amazonense]|uniref:Sulfate ABC transporter ATP-binding protein n=1 Tax=Chromobacterium amazonense TaxID=1382803 RepID=A0A2S9X274_9NEIS|nr:sulfate ABC transporter ATP-binding protein [Chromobacterium amazonense]KIA79510.1 sulfate ABC transporter [Chromobacterium piscinae]MBM2883524.1 sulfate ABC transporter ATP-binding protein [Chromobacterium amazonense]MDE1712343.1 sulfate ABC transporter ATP-binding protein [Chromobacterium amazonense]PRP69783.1 sulfate ABC transporter ATP-binding protein [Chromobacterium amazonense]